MNSTEFVIRDGTVVFSLDNQWMATMIAKKRKGDFDTYFFVIDIIVSRSDKKLLGCCFWRTIMNHGSSSWNI